MRIRNRFEQIKKALRVAQEKTTVKVIGSYAGLSKVSLYHWLNDDAANPSLDKLEKLESWLIDNEYLDI